MLQAKLIDRRKLKLENVDIPEINKRQVLIQIRICGVCGTDIHFYEDRHPFIHPRMVLGHEFSGIVEKVGAEVNDVKVGEKVTVEPIIACGKCINCLQNRHDICQNLQFIGAFGHNGGFAEYVVVPSDIVVPVSEEISFDDAALIEPLAVGVHAVKRSGLSVGDKAVVLGAGTIGLSTMQAVRAAGASEVIIVDPLNYRLKTAVKLGADVAVTPDQLEETVKKKWGQTSADVWFDCVGLEETLSEAIKLARPGTKVAVIGCPQNKLSVDVILIQNNEIEIIGCVTYTPDDFATARNLVEKKKANMGALVTHRYKLEDIEEAFKLMLAREEEVIKVLIEINKR